MNAPQSISDRIRLVRNMAGLTRKEIEDKFEISSNTLQSWEAGRNNLTIKGAKRLNEIFIRLGILCSDNWLLTGNGQSPIFLQNVSELPMELTEDFRILREIEAFKAINPDPVIVAITDDGMEPLYEIGDYVCGNKKESDQIKEILGECCIIETFMGDTLVRKILAGSKETLFTLSCTNIRTNQQPIIPDVKIKYAAKIVMHRKKENK